MSPLLWLVFFDKVPGEMARHRYRALGEEIEYRDLIYADDVTSLVSTNRRETLGAAARYNAETLKQILESLGLKINDAKTNCMVLNPVYLPGGVFQRTPYLRPLSTPARVRDRLMREERLRLMREESDPTAEVTGGIEPREWMDENFPFPLKAVVRVLGVDIDWYLSFDEHFASTLKKAQVRQGLLSRVARSSWGLEWGVLRMTHDAVITSLMRYALCIVGSCLPTDLFRKLDTMIVNIAARKIGGLNRTVRIESLHFLSGTKSMSNLFAIHCAEFLDSCLRAANSDIKIRIERELCVYLGIDTIEITNMRIAIPRDRGEPVPPAITPDITWDRTVWTSSCYQKPLSLDRLPKANST